MSLKIEAIQAELSKLGFLNGRSEPFNGQWDRVTAHGYAEYARSQSQHPSLHGQPKNLSAIKGPLREALEALADGEVSGHSAPTPAGNGDTAPHGTATAPQTAVSTPNPPVATPPVPAPENAAGASAPVAAPAADTTTKSSKGNGSDEESGNKE